MAQRKRLSASQGSQSKRHSSSLRSQEEDEDGSFTQPSMSQVQRGLEKLTPTQVDQKTAEVVQYILMKDQKKIPVRRADLVKHVVKEYRNVYAEIIKRASTTFEQVFGLKLLEIDPKNHLYILVNNLDEPAPTAAPLVCPTNPKMGLLFVILSVIFMKGGMRGSGVRETLIWNTLRKLRVDPGQKHEEFGDVKKLVSEEFVRQKYLEYVRIPHTEPLEYEIRWGPRADVEVSKAKILEFMGQLYDQQPQSWTQQYREAHSTHSPTQPRGQK
uniref:Necdin-like 2 n=1 Tax=Nothobranchius kadleci TaxID=1051664 RepID=A0A1A8DFY3_NOTKA